MGQRLLTTWLVVGIPLLLSACGSNRAVPQPRVADSPPTPQATQEPQPTEPATDAPVAITVVATTPAVESTAGDQPEQAPAVTGDCPAEGPTDTVSLTDHSIETTEPLKFQTRSTALKAGGDAQIDAIARLLCQHPDVHIELGVHTDSRGSAGFNRRLSQQRADALSVLLQRRGIAADRILATGYGESAPITGAPPDIQNRVEIVIRPR